MKKISRRAFLVGVGEFYLGLTLPFFLKYEYPEPKIVQCNIKEVYSTLKGDYVWKVKNEDGEFNLSSNFPIHEIPNGSVEILYRERPNKPTEIVYDQKGKIKEVEIDGEIVELYPTIKERIFRYNREI